MFSVNFHRRHLNESQRAMVAAKFATLKPGDVSSQQSGLQICTPTVEQAAERLNVSTRSVMNGKTVLAEGTPEEIKAVETGQAAVSTTARWPNSATITSMGSAPAARGA